ncbi:hypothetical protein ElyMa_001013700 [Elysia marginata]|uniref:Uncharacterized protein n=1 Tax=Elysia marginata TaxID=1093978 RepID=A0AAV4HK23_9GAST|nr:hypothetical protein ElyMa_001013700 [Elysia marginata]
MSTALMGRVEGCRKKGRPAILIIDNITTTTGLSLGEVIHRSRDPGLLWHPLEEQSSSTVLSTSDKCRVLTQAPPSSVIQKRKQNSLPFVGLSFVMTQRTI